jgi:hypothetical protein
VPSIYALMVDHWYRSVNGVKFFHFMETSGHYLHHSMLQHPSLYCFCIIQLHGVEAHQFIPADFSKLVFDLTVYSATSWENDDDLFSNNLVGESYSSMRPETWLQILRENWGFISFTGNATSNFHTHHDLEAKPCHCQEQRLFDVQWLSLYSQRNAAWAFAE